MSIQAPSAGTECTCLPGFGVQLCRVLCDMPSFLNCCHVVRMEEANNTRLAMTIYNEEHSAKLSQQLIVFVEYCKTRAPFK